MDRRGRTDVSGGDNGSFAHCLGAGYRPRCLESRRHRDTDRYFRKHVEAFNTSGMVQ